MAFPRLLPLLAAALLLAGCGSPTGSVVPGPLSVRAHSSELRLHNRTDRPVYLFVVERETAARIDWVPCTDPAACDGLAPAESRTIAYRGILGYEAGDEEALVYWWHLVPRSGGGHEMDHLRTIRVRL